MPRILLVHASALPLIVIIYEIGKSFDLIDAGRWWQGKNLYGAQGIPGDIRNLLGIACASGFIYICARCHIHLSVFHYYVSLVFFLVRFVRV